MDKSFIEEHEKSIYISNNLGCFYFHDAYFLYSKFHDGHMTWIIDGANLLKESSQNLYNVDMSIADLKITFDKVELNSIIIESENILDSTNRLGFLLNLGDGEWEILQFNQCENNKIKIILSGDKFRYAEIEFVYSEFKAKWTKYNGQSWYVTL